MKKNKLVSVLAGVMAAVMLLSLMLSLFPKASAASSSEIRNQINALKSQREELKGKINALGGQKAANDNEIQNLIDQRNVNDQEIVNLYDQIDNINQQLSAYALLIADKQDELDDAQARLDELNEKNKERIRTMEEDGNLSYWSVLFKANSFSDLLDRLNMIEEIASADKRRLEEMSAAAEKVAAAQKELETEKSELEVAKTELDKTQADLEKKQQESEKLLKELIAKGVEFDQLLAESTKNKDKILQDIAQKEKEFDKAKHQEWLATSVPPTTTQPPKKPDGSGGNSGNGGSNNGGSNNGGSNNGGSGNSGQTSPNKPAPSGWVSPLTSYRISDPFGPRKHPILGYVRNHNGVDMAAPAGTPIYATRSGKVTIATYHNECGNYVSINHGDGYASVYMHMTRFVVSAGSYVNAGQLIGYVGSTGLATGPHLHFGVSYNGTYVNPMQFI